MNFALKSYFIYRIFIQSRPSFTTLAPFCCFRKIKAAALRAAPCRGLSVACIFWHRFQDDVTVIFIKPLIQPSSELWWNLRNSFKIEGLAPFKFKRSVGRREKKLCLARFSTCLVWLAAKIRGNYPIKSFRTGGTVAAGLLSPWSIIFRDHFLAPVFQHRVWPLP